MTKTEIALLAVYRMPAVRLDDICEKYLNMTPRHANERAAMNMLGIPTFRIGVSRKAPRMVHIEDLARFIDASAATAKQDWETSQV
jgi:hypothetical protein